MIKKLGYTASVAIACIALGFLLIGLAWDGAASVDFPQGQIPYLLSGGAVGVGLIIVGAGLLLFEAGRRSALRLGGRIDELAEAIRGINGGEAEEEAEAAPMRAAAAANGQVVVGRSSFHRPDCRLVADKDEVDLATPEQAVERGLQPCRVCDPVGTLSKK